MNPSGHPPLGNDLYIVDNVPFHAYGLNYGDVVRATADDPTLKPEVRAVVRPSGHQTLRIFFPRTVPEPDRLPFLETLASYGVTFEGRDASFFALDIAPDGQYDALCAHLTTWQERGFLEFETCEARRANNFDDLPNETSDAVPDAS